MDTNDNGLRGLGKETRFVIYEYNPETGIVRADYDEIIKKVNIYLQSLGLKHRERKP